MQAFLQGTVNNSYVETPGLFGTADLDGLGFELTFIYDTRRGIRDIGTDYDQVYGGTQYSVDSPMISAVLSINGFSQSVFGSKDGIVANSRGIDGFGDPFDSVTFLAGDETVDASGKVTAYGVLVMPLMGYPFGIPLNLETPFELSGLTASNSGGIFAFGVLDPPSGIVARTTGGLTAATLTVTVVPSPVPLPASLWLMLLVLAALILVARSRAPVPQPV